MKRKVLFLCTKNSARSQFAESVLNHLKNENLIAYSAGSNPDKIVNPLAAKILTRIGFDMSGKRPKPIDEFMDQEFDFIITLCDRMKEECPVFPGKPILAHWGMEDPSDFEGTEEEKQKLFEKTLYEITYRINLFINIPIEKLDRLALEQQVNDIGSKNLL